MNSQISGYVTVADFVEMVRRKFDAQKTPAQKQDEKIAELGSARHEPSHAKQERHVNQSNEKYGVDITV